MHWEGFMDDFELMYRNEVEVSQRRLAETNHALHERDEANSLINALTEEDLTERGEVFLSSAAGKRLIGLQHALEDARRSISALSRRIEELREGLERIAELCGHAEYNRAVSAIAREARSLLHPEPQEKSQVTEDNA